jgi:hypothetical protein
MRALFRFAAIASVLAFAAAQVAAKPKKKKVADDTEVVSPDAKRGMIVLTDGEGSVIAIDKTWTDDHLFYYGDGKTLYRQRVFGGGADGGAGTWDLSFWAPRVTHASITQQPAGTFKLYCGDTEVKLTKVADADAKKTLDVAVFKKPLWRRQAQFLARDDQGTYYYVDRLRDEFGGKGHRIFAGQKGAMKEMPMTNLVSDSKGEIYATKSGELRFITSSNAASWVKGKETITLTIVPPEDNIPMIYGDLGIYDGSLGTPCDDY